MKTTTFLVVAAILLSFIVEESDGKVTTVLHHGRIRSLQKKRRRTEKKGQPKANQKGGNHTKHAGYRTQKVGYYLKVFCFLLYKIKRIILFKQNLLVVLAYKNRKCTESKTILFYLFRNTPDGTSLQAGWPSDWTSPLQLRCKFYASTNKKSRCSWETGFRFLYLHEPDYTWTIS